MGYEIHLIYLGYLRIRAGCIDQLPPKMKKNKNCRKLNITCEKLKNKCMKKLRKAIGNSRTAKRCKRALKRQGRVKVHVYCKFSCKKCGNKFLINVDSR